MNVQHSLIRELMLYELQLSHNAAEASKNISCSVDHCIVNKWFKKFRLCCKNVDDQARSGRLKRVDAEAMFQAVEANPVSSIRRVSGEPDIEVNDHYGCVKRVSGEPDIKVNDHYGCVKSIRNRRILSHVTKILQNF